MLYNFLSLVQTEKNSNTAVYIILPITIIAVIVVLALKDNKSSNSFSKDKKSTQILVDNNAQLAENDLNALKEDFENGIISKQEYEQLKAEIIDKL